jgi:uncharacterized protein (UPF0335 family)
MIGHNSNDSIKRLVERIERLEAEKKNLAEDIREIYVEAKSQGYDPKVLRQVVKYRAADKAKREEMEALLQSYLEAMGDYISTPLGQAGAPGH